MTLLVLFGIVLYVALAGGIIGLYVAYAVGIVLYVAVTVPTILELLFLLLISVSF